MHADLQATRDDGIVLHHGPGASLDSITKPVLSALLRGSGYVVLRGFDVNLSRFSDFVRRHSSRLSLDPARVFHGATGQAVAQKVDAGNDAIGLHCENGNSPFWPDLCWFYCEVAPRIGSQTTVCDGTRVFGDLGPQSRRAFQERDILYTRRVRESLWKTYVARSDSARGGDDTQALFEQLRSLADSSGRTELLLNADASITYRFRTPAVLARSPFNADAPAFANSLFGPSFNYERPVITFADGEPIDAQVLEEAREACDRHTRDIDWQPNDVAVLDNRRVMHGRRAIADSLRTIYNALSYV